MSRSLVKQGGARLRKAAEEDPATTKPQVEAASPSVPASEPASKSTSIIASGKANGNSSGKAGGKAGVSVSEKASESAGGKAGGRAGRRRGRPRGPDRVPLSVRVLTTTDDRLTQAVELTGQSPQYIVEAALDRYFKRLGV